MFIPDMVEEDEGGIMASHPNRFTLPLLVAPSHPDKPDAINTVRHSIMAVACVKLPDEDFEFDSSFVLTGSGRGFRQLMGAISRHENCPISLFGHADPEGRAGYNKWLSERRAEAVYAVLIRDVDTWERLYSSQPARGEAVGDVWGDKTVKYALTALGYDYNEEAGEKLKDAIMRFQSAQGDPKPSGRNDATLRKAVFFQYMQLICRTKDGLPYALSKKDFLGEGGEHGPFQGCSEFNLQVILAGEEAKAYEKRGKTGKDNRHGANADNRRVVAFLFERGTRIEPTKWPCPRAKDRARYLQGCIDHLWSDQKSRLTKQYPLRRRRFGKQVRGETDRMSRPEMTFGCRFYHGIAQRSPCERDMQMYAIQLLVDAPTDARNKGDPNRFRPAANVRFVAVLGDSAQAAVVRGRTTENGMIGIPFLSPLSSIRLRVDVAGIALGGIPMEDPPVAAASDTDGKGAASPNGSGNGAQAASPQTGDDAPPKHADTDRYDDEDTFIEHMLRPDRLFRIKPRPEPAAPEEPPPEWREPDADVPPVSNEERTTGGRQRLFNLGYGTGLGEVWTEAQLARFVSRFQKDEGIPETGVLDDPTIDRLRQVHGG